VRTLKRGREPGRGAENVTGGTKRTKNGKNEHQEDHGKCGMRFGGYSNISKEPGC